MSWPGKVFLNEKAVSHLRWAMGFRHQEPCVLGPRDGNMVVGVFKEEKEGRGSWTMVHAGPEGAQAPELGRGCNPPSLGEPGGECPLSSSCSWKPLEGHTREWRSLASV